MNPIAFYYASVVSHYAFFTVQQKSIHVIIFGFKKYRVRNFFLNIINCFGYVIGDQPFFHREPRSFGETQRTLCVIHFLCGSLWLISLAELLQYKERDARDDDVCTIADTIKKSTTRRFRNRTISFACNKFLHYIIDENSSTDVTDHFFHTLFTQYFSNR